MRCLHLFSISSLLLAALLCVAQTENKPAINDDFVHKQFGNEFTLQASEPPLTADLDGDGVEDLVLVARAKNPLVDQADLHYKVLDPYHSFFGFGDPRITTQFASENPEGKSLVLLIIHGAGPDAWRGATPKAKFVIINLPFKQIAVKHLQLRRKRVMAIYAQEATADQMTSVIFFDGKKYKYEPMGSNMQ